MIVAHLSDLHLGFRAYPRTERGRNVRERDVAGAFHRAVEEIIRLRPDLVLVAGDVFDRPDPPPPALVALTRGLDALGSALPDTRVLMVAGARDTPRRPGDPGALAALDTFPGVEAATGTSRSVSLPEHSAHVCMLPYRSLLRDPRPVPEPEPRMRWNLVLAYGRPAGERGPGLEIDADAWDYVALGSEHVRTELSPRALYPGSLERVVARPWTEAAVEKGFLTMDLTTGRSSFHVIPGRPVVALAPIRVPADDPEALRARVREVTDEVPGGIDGKIVHLTLRGIPYTDVLALQGPLLHELRSRALHLSVDVEDEEPGPGDGLDVEARIHRALETAEGATADRVERVRELLARDPRLGEGEER
jgi:DNA repair exonuclease SbcCD nuclease subunit